MTPDMTKLMPSTMISKKDYGIKIAKRGYDVSYASDTELLYNSSFPVLAIANYISEDTPREVIRERGYRDWETKNILKKIDGERTIEEIVDEMESFILSKI